MTTERMIFSLNPGRCGTLYLHMMMRTVPDVCSLHEPPPFFHENAKLPYEEKKKWLEDVKIPYILGLAQSIYVETSNQVVRGFIEPMLELGHIPDAIVIHRNARDVALSLWRAHIIPGRSPIAIVYALSPDDDDLFFPYSNFEYWTDYQCCFWHVLEYMRRMEVYTNMLENAGGTVVRTTFANLVTQKGFLEILTALGLPEPDYIRYNDIVGIRFNETSPMNTLKWPGGNLDKQEQDVLDCF
jgi:hypothetical protein